MVKLGVDTLSTVPAAPPGDGADRALDPPPPGCPEGPGFAEEDAAAEGAAAVAEGVAAQPAETPITASISAPATTHPLFLFDSNRRTRGRRACLAMLTEAGPEPAELPATGGVGVALDTGSGTGSWGLVGS
jgi:hypothetical protein